MDQTEVTTPPQSGNPHHHARDRVKEAVVEGVQSEIIRLFNAHRNEIAEWIFDLVPDAHMHTAENIAKWLPRVAQLFKIATPPGFVFDPMDDIVQDLAQAIKDVAEQRGGHGHTAAPAQSHASAPPKPAEPTPKRFFSLLLLLDEAEADDLRVWHDGLTIDQQKRLYALCDSMSSEELSQLLSGPLTDLETAMTRVKLPQKPMAFLAFRAAIAADDDLRNRVNDFLEETGISPARFWKFIEKHYGNRVKNLEEFGQLMQLWDEDIVQYLHMAPFFLKHEDFRRAIRVAGIGIARGARLAGQGIGDGAREIGHQVVIQSTAANAQLNTWGLQMQAAAPQPKTPRTRPSLYDRIVNRLFA